MTTRFVSAGLFISLVIYFRVIFSLTVIQRIATQVSHAVLRSTGALVVGESRFRLPAPFLVNQVFDPLPHAMVVGHVIVQGPPSEETR